jgi:K+-transporting ATPase KdpF subunit
MSGELLLCAVLAAGLLCYLIAALLNPEDFS